MNHTILKSDWERRDAPVELTLNTAQQLLQPVTKATIASITLFSAGCANSNFKLTMDDGQTYVLRLYTRDSSALMREQGINRLVNSILPVANFLHVDDSCTIIPYPYAIMEFKEGILLRDLIFTNNRDAITEATNEAGFYLGMLGRLKLPMGGFFQPNMAIKSFNEEDDYFSLLMNLLQNNIVATSLGKNVQNNLEQIIAACYHLLPPINDANLTHGDYDAANILVKETNGKWEVSAILDWEFAHAGTYLMDMGIMLRYSQKLPEYFENSFLQGIKEAGISLPSDWKKQAKLLDMLCLLELLRANPADVAPTVNRDVVRLLANMPKEFSGGERSS